MCWPASLFDEFQAGNTLSKVNKKYLEQPKVVLYFQFACLYMFMWPALIQTRMCIHINITHIHTLLHPFVLTLHLLSSYIVPCLAE